MCILSCLLFHLNGCVFKIVLPLPPPVHNIDQVSVSPRLRVSLWRSFRLVTNHAYCTFREACMYIAHTNNRTAFQCQFKNHDHESESVFSEDAFDEGLISRSSTSNSSAAFGGISGGKPRAPYA